MIIHCARLVLLIKSKVFRFEPFVSVCSLAVKPCALLAAVASCTVPCEADQLAFEHPLLHVSVVAGYHACIVYTKSIQKLI